MAHVFASKTPQNDKATPQVFTKYPMQRLELPIKKYIKLLSVDLERLNKHAVNITRLTKFEDWVGLNKEQVNATRTVQQINTNIKEIEKAGKQVIAEDLNEFDKRINPIKLEAVEAMAALVAFIGQGPLPSPTTDHKSQDHVEIGTGDIDLDSLLSTKTGTNRVPASDPLEQLTASSKKVSTSEGQKEQSISTSNKNLSIIRTSESSQPGVPNEDDIDGHPASNSTEVLHTEQISLLTTDLHVAPQNSQATASWEELQESIMDLSSLVQDFASRVEEQGESVDAIDDHIDQAEANVAQGTTHLAKASKYKSFMFPVVGAVVGGVVGGPIGLLAGMKIGGMAGVVGGAVGLAGGNLYKKRQDQITNIEMSNMSVKRSQSMPEVLDQEDNVDEPLPSLSNDVNSQSKSFSLGQVNFDKFFSYFSSEEEKGEEKK